MERVIRLEVGWLKEGYRERRRCSRDSYPESYITKYTRIRTKEPRLSKRVSPNILTPS